MVTRAILLMFSLFTGAHALGQSISQTPKHYDGQSFDLQAHRGGLGLVTESSLQAFANAMRLGVTTLELDIQISEDRVAIVTHDRQVAAEKCRDTAPLHAADTEFPYVGKFIKDLSLAQIQTLDCGSLVLDDFPQQRLVPGVTMPTLLEVLHLVKLYSADELILNIETKVEAGAPHETAPREQFVSLVLHDIDIAAMRDQVTIQSFDWAALMLMRERAGKIPIIALLGQSFLRCGESGSSPWTGGIDADDYQCNPIAIAHSFGASAISPVHGDPQDGSIGQTGYVPFVTEKFVRDAHDIGMKVIPWTVDDPATATHLVKLGVDGIITNYPDRLRDVMAEFNIPLPKAYFPPENCETKLTPEMNPILCDL